MNSNKDKLKISERELVQKLKKSPKDLNLILSLGILKASKKKYLDAANIFQEGILYHPDNDTLEYNCAIALVDGQKFFQGALKLRKLLSKYPDNDKILSSYAKALYELKKYTLSFKYYYKAYTHNKTNLDILINIGIVLIKLSKYLEALEFLKLANKSKSKRSLILRNIAFCYKSLNNYDFAISFYLESINLEDSYIGSYIELGSIYLDMNKYDLANNIFHKASTIAQNILESHKLDSIKNKTLYEIGVLFTIIGNYILAEKSLKILNERQTNNLSCKILLADALLSRGKFKEGWHYYESRFEYYLKEKNIDKYRNFPKPIWNPSLGNETILIWAEQGLGDQILHGTMLKDFTSRFKKVYLMVDERIKNFFSNYLNGVITISLNENLNENLYDYHIPLGSIGKYSRTTINDFNLNNNLVLENKISKISQDQRKVKCAVSWKSISGNRSKYKSLNLKDLYYVLNNPKIDFYNIQYSNETDDLNDLKKIYNISLKTPDGVDAYNDINGLMDFIKDCDFVITVSNTNAHLSGILNKPTMLLLPKIYGKFWYWNNEYANINMWYPSIKIFSQKNIGDWSSAIDDLNEYINKNFIHT